MIVVVLTVVAQEPSGGGIEAGELFDAGGPIVGHAGPQPLDDPHGAEHVGGIRARRAVHQEGVQGLGPHVAELGTDLQGLAPRAHVVVLQHLVVAMLLLRVGRSPCSGHRRARDRSSKPPG